MSPLRVSSVGRIKRNFHYTAGVALAIDSHRLRDVSSGAREIKLKQFKIADWLTEHPDCYPPVVLNLTDGNPTDGDPTDQAQGLRELASTDGKVLLFNLHVSSNANPSVQFPDSDADLPDQYAELLFDMSSVLPLNLRSYALQQGFAGSSAMRGFIFNAGAEDIVKFIDIGTRPDRQDELAR